MTRPTLSLNDLLALKGREIGVSAWSTMDQNRINLFADTTEDHQFIHVDPEQAAGTPFGGTIAHGFLTLSMLAKMAMEVTPLLDHLVMGVNYGFDRVRFMEPVRAGKRIRSHFTLADVVDKGRNRFLLTYEVTMEIEGNTKPALMADWLTMQIVDPVREGSAPL